jgi:hypothetical protein
MLAILTDSPQVLRSALLAAAVADNISGSAEPMLQRQVAVAVAYLCCAVLSCPARVNKRAEQGSMNARRIVVSVAYAKHRLRSQ